MLVLNTGPCCSKHSWEYFVINLFFLGHNGSVVEHKYSLTLLSMSFASSQTQKSNKDGFFCSNIYLLILGRFRRRRRRCRRRHCRRHRIERLKITNANRSQGDGESKDRTNSFFVQFLFFWRISWNFYKFTLSGSGGQIHSSYLVGLGSNPIWLQVSLFNVR